MSIVKSIENEFGGFTVQIGETHFWMRLRGSTVSNIIYIQKVAETWNEHSDVKIFSDTLQKITDIQNALFLESILCFEFLDRHVYMILKRWDKSRKDEYTFLPKEIMQQIKGGEYSIDKLIEDLPERIPGHMDK